MIRLALAFTLITSPLPLHAETLSGRIVGVSDGDTATLLTSSNKSVKIRLAQIDAPEKNQAFGEKSKQSLSDLIFGKQVSVEVETKDRYGRSVGKIKVAGVDANLEQVKRGMAWFYVQYGKDSAYRNAEASARFNRVGLWSEPNPVPPWVFRRGGKSSTAAKQMVATSGSTSMSGNCGTKRYCKEMSSCEEAKFYLQQCGVKTIDGDEDGVPCEKLCR